jgi:hypothetical protein
LPWPEKQRDTTHDEYMLALQHLIDSAGGVPADIPLWARVDCLAKQRDGECPIPDMRRFGRDRALA